MVPSAHLKFGIDRILLSTFSNGKLISPPFVRALTENVPKSTTGGAHYKVHLVIGKRLKISSSKRKRVKFTDYQRYELEIFFSSKKYVRGAELHSLSERLGLKPVNVKIWFQNKRARLKEKTACISTA